MESCEQVNALRIVQVLSVYLIDSVQHITGMARSRGHGHIQNELIAGNRYRNLITCLG